MPKCPTCGHRLKMLPLTEREKQIARLVLLGHQYEEIANTLRLSINTIKAVMVVVRKKTDAKNNMDFARSRIGYLLIEKELKAIKR